MYVDTPRFLFHGAKETQSELKFSRKNYFQNKMNPGMDLTQVYCSYRYVHMWEISIIAAFIKVPNLIGITEARAAIYSLSRVSHNASDTGAGRRSR
jgi:hypothetical protein